MDVDDVLGLDAEQAVVKYLEGCGFRILDRNWRCADGEIAIVAVDRQTFVVCEVKTRSGRGTARRSRPSAGQSAADFAGWGFSG
jgi:putative endonuclease